MATTRNEFEQDLETYFEDIFRDYIDPVSRERLKDEDGSELDLPVHFEDEQHSIPDACVPVYNREIVELWLDLGMPDADEGLSGENPDPIQYMTAAIYEHGYNVVGSLMSEYGFFE